MAAHTKQPPAREANTELKAFYKSNVAQNLVKHKRLTLGELLSNGWRAMGGLMWGGVEWGRAAELNSNNGLSHNEFMSPK